MPVVLPERDVQAQAAAPAHVPAAHRRRCGGCSRVLTLLTLDFVGVTAALATAHRDQARPARRLQPSARRGATPAHPLAVRLPAHGADVRPGGPLRRPAAAPRPAQDLRRAVPGHGDRAGLRAGHGQPLHELLHLLRRAVLRHRLHLGPARAATRGSPAGCSSRPATGAGRCWSARAGTSRRWPTRWAAARGHRSTSSATSRSRRDPRTACGRWAGSTSSPTCSATSASRR